MGPDGLEPSTYALSERRSNQLSYEPVEEKESNPKPKRFQGMMCKDSNRNETFATTTPPYASSKASNACKSAFVRTSRWARTFSGSQFHQASF